jgi:hypothetical protein
MGIRLTAAAAAAISLSAAAASAQAPAPAPLAVPNPHYTTLILEVDINRPAQAVWARVGSLDAQGMLNIGDKPIESLGVRGDVAGRLARGVSDIARRNGQTDLVITPEGLLAQNLFQFAATIKRWNLTFVQEPSYISGSGGRYENEGALRFHLQPLLESRAKARDDYRALLEAGDGWLPGWYVREPMGRWSFADATRRMAEATSVLELRSEVAAAAATEGLSTVAVNGVHDPKAGHRHE